MGSEKASNDRTRGNVIVPVLIIVSCIILLSYNLFTNDAFRSELVQQYQNRQSAVADSNARGMEVVFTRLTSELRTIAASSYVEDPTSPECKLRMREFYKSYQDIVYAGYRMDSTGVLVYMYPTQEQALNANIGSQAHVVDMIRTRKLVVSGLFRALEGFDAIAIHAPVFKEGYLNGSIATIINVNRVTKLFFTPMPPSQESSGKIELPKEQPSASDSNRGIWLIDQDETIIYHPDEKYIGSRIGNIAFFQNDSSGLKTFRQQLWRRNRAHFQLDGYLFAISPMQAGDRSWTVIQCTPFSDISGPISKHLIMSWMQTAGALLLLLIFGLVVMRNGMRAIRLETENRLLEEKLGLEEELHASHNRLDLIVKTIPSGLFTVDAEMRVLSWNKNAELITGYSESEVLGNKCDLILGASCSGLCSLFDEGAPTKPITGRECSLTTKDGRRLIISKNADFLRTPDGTVTGGIESFIDVTHAKRAEEERINAIALEKKIEQLREMDRVKTNFISMVSHELRTPLSVMLGNLSMAVKGKYGELPDKLMEKLVVINRRGWQLNQLIDDILDISRIESGRVKPEKQHVSIARTAEEVFQEQNEEIVSKNLHTVTNISPDAPEVFADLNMFKRLVSNLVGNAVKFTPQGGSIEVTSKAVDGFVEVSVKDSGIGMPENEQDKIFDRFYQVDNSSTRQYGGAGLGLAIVREIVSTHEGEIEVSSRLGQGTEMIVKFPTASFSRPVDSASPADLNVDFFPLLEKIENRTGTILILDNDLDSLTSVTNLLSGSFVRILAMSSFKAAQEVLEKEKADVLIIDPANLADEDIKPAAEYFKSDSVGRPQVVFWSDPSGITPSIEKMLNVDLRLSKPVDPVRFLECIDRLLPG